MEHQSQTDRPSPYDFLKSSDFLKSYWQFYQSTKQGHGLRSLARECGLNGHSHLSRVFQGKKIATKNLIQKLSPFIGISTDECSYLFALIDLEKADSPDQKRDVFYKIRNLGQRTPVGFRVLKEFSVFSNPLAMQILELSGIPNVKMNPEALDQILIDSPGVDTIKKLMTNLEKAGLLVNGKKVEKYLTSQKDIRDLSVQSFHKASSDQAKRALNHVDVLNREYNSFCLAINPTELPKIKNYLRATIDTLIQSFEQIDDDSEIYQINCHFYPTTNRNSQNKKGELNA